MTGGVTQIDPAPESAELSRLKVAARAAARPRRQEAHDAMGGDAAQAVAVRFLS